MLSLKNINQNYLQGDSIISVLSQLNFSVNGVKNIGIGSDLCLDQPDKIVEWMRNGTWT